MGVQITIERNVLEAAGWKCSVVDNFYEECDDNGYCVDTVNYPELCIEKEGLVFYSMFADCFCADCNEWGTNKARFIAAGLFELEHCLG